MTNAERIARDICLLVGQYERCEITAKGFIKKVEQINTIGCAGCVFDYRTCEDCSCFDGRSIWLDAEAES